MVTELGLLSVTKLHRLSKSQQQQQQQPNITTSPQIGGSWMWNINTTARSNSDEDSWEVQAFAEDTNMGTTWPPRSYTCTFCRREFMSAQALGGHMNVHRRDRARLRQSPANISADSTSYPCPIPTSASTLLFPTEEFLAAANNGGGGLCVFYPLSSSSINNTSHGSTTTAAAIFLRDASVNGCSVEISPSPLLSMSNYPANMLISPSTTSSICPPPTVCFSRVTDQTGQSLALIHSHENEDRDKKTCSSDYQLKCNLNNNHNTQFVEELDLELRLGSSR